MSTSMNEGKGKKRKVPTLRASKKKQAIEEPGDCPWGTPKLAVNEMVSSVREGTGRKKNQQSKLQRRGTGTHVRSGENRGDRG